MRQQSIMPMFQWSMQHPLRRVTVCSDAMRALRWVGCANLDQMLLACNYLQVRCARCAAPAALRSAGAQPPALSNAAAPLRTAWNPLHAA